MIMYMYMTEGSTQYAASFADNVAAGVIQSLSRMMDPTGQDVAIDGASYLISFTQRPSASSNLLEELVQR